MLIFILSVMVVVTSAGVFWRYGLNSALSWSEELGCYLLVWVSFLGAALATSRGSHIGIALVFDRLSLKARFWIQVIVDMIIIFFMSSILAGGIKILPSIHARTATTLPIPMSIPYLVMPFSAGVIIFYILVRLITGFKKRNDQ